jgi:hypothetical protein
MLFCIILLFITVLPLTAALGRSVFFLFCPFAVVVVLGSVSLPLKKCKLAITVQDKVKKGEFKKAYAEINKRNKKLPFFWQLYFRRQLLQVPLLAQLPLLPLNAQKQ